MSRRAAMAQYRAPPSAPYRFLSESVGWFRCCLR